MHNSYNQPKRDKVREAIIAEIAVEFGTRSQTMTPGDPVSAYQGISRDVQWHIFRDERARRALKQGEHHILAVIGMPDESSEQSITSTREQSLQALSDIAIDSMVDPRLTSVV